MIDFHTHTLFSDGELVPSELVRRAHMIGYRAIGISDHVDSSNIDFVLPRIVKVAKDLNSCWDIKVIPGVEITHAPLQQIPKLIKYARRNGAQVVIVHGETPSEPVLPGTNRVGIECGADILAHPGYITWEDAELAGEKGVYLELSARKLHKTANKHVANLAKEAGASLILNTDAHCGSDLITDRQARRLLSQLGLKKHKVDEILNNSLTFLNALIRK